MTLSHDHDLARAIIDHGLTAQDLGPRLAEPARRAGAEEAAEEAAPERAVPRLALHEHWPRPELAPRPRALPDEPRIFDPLPRADFLVITWTVAEQDALAAVLTPGVTRQRWYRYARGFERTYLPMIREGAPARVAHRLGSYYLCEVGGASVLCFKSELHLNQDGIRRPSGGATLPVKDLFKQLIAEVRPRLVITVGTAGATFPDHDLGDVMITRAAKFRCQDEFRDAPFNGQTFASKYQIPTRWLDDARALLRHQDDMLVEPGFAPPTQHYPWQGPPLPGRRNRPTIRVEGGGGPGDLPAGLPILTTDFFEFGTTANELWTQGCAVEMGDAVLGLAASELEGGAPPWLVIRNASDPAINAALPRSKVQKLDMQAHWAVWYYEAFGFWTSVNSAIATWAIIAGEVNP
jgi:nucleoside phosphorylase